jgi:hypothetical protein
MDDCSCCTNSDNCPLGTESCFDAATRNSFCAKIQNDPKCQSASNPICKNYSQSDTESDTPKGPAPTLAPEYRDDGTSKGLYALSALVLVPLIIVSVFIGKRFYHKTRGSAIVEPSNTSPDLPPTNLAKDPVPSPDPSGVSQSNMVEGNDISASVLDDASRQSSVGGVSSSAQGVSQRQLSPPGIESYTLANKDQCRTHIGEIKEIPVADALPME